jgi:hypothetical protein
MTILYHDGGKCESLLPPSSRPAVRHDMILFRRYAEYYLHLEMGFGWPEEHPIEERRGSEALGTHGDEQSASERPYSAFDSSPLSFQNVYWSEIQKSAVWDDMK